MVDIPENQTILNQPCVPFWHCGEPNKYPYIYIYIYIYITHMWLQKTIALLSTKPPSDDDPEVKHGFAAKASLSITQSTPAVSYNTTRIYWFSIPLWECQKKVQPRHVILCCIHNFLVQVLIQWYKIWINSWDFNVSTLNMKLEVKIPWKPWAKSVYKAQ